VAPSTLAYVTPAVLRWARESIGYDLGEAASRLHLSGWQLEAAEEGVDLLTLRQAESAAKLYERPLAALYLAEPPSEEPQEAQFRRLPGSPEPPWPPEMRVLARHVRNRQDAAAELYELLEETPPWRGIRDQLADVPESNLAGAARAALGITLGEQTSWHDPSGYTPLRRWIDAIESLGIISVQDGTMPVALMRGFASVHPLVPAVVANMQDDPRSRAFTLVHELGHHLAGVGRAHGSDSEAWCENFAGEVILPREPFADELSRSPHVDPVATIDHVAVTFGVTPLAAAVRARRYGLIDQGRADALIDAIRRRHQDRAEDTQRRGGNYYYNEIGHLGPAFIRLVLTAADTQAVTYPAASGLLGIKVNNFDKLREHLERRGAR
jgi:Zn-dependent peptidase ImmA (M78 family)